jgi:hypothetical protein
MALPFFKVQNRDVRRFGCGIVFSRESKRVRTFLWIQ